MGSGVGRRIGVCLLLALAGPTAPPDVSAQALRPAEPAFWAASGAALAGAWHFDARLRDVVRGQSSPAADRLAAAGYEAAMGANVAGVLGSALLVSHLTGWPEPSERFLNVAAGYILPNVLTEGIKVVAGRGRPRATEDPREFRPFAREGNWKSLPSGHATSAFAFMAALSREFDLPLVLEGMGYGMAGVVAWSRVYHDGHWPSDVVAGAIIGIAGARTTVAWLQRRDRDGDDAGAAGATGTTLPVILLRIPLP